jgi:hypothetical protein
MGCSDNWARDNMDREEVRQRHEEERQKLMQRRYSGDHPDEVDAINGIPPQLREQMIHEQTVRRALRYSKQFVKVLKLLSDDQIEKLLLNDLEFRDSFTEQQSINKENGLDWIECKFSELILLYPEQQVELIKHKGSK